MYFKTLLTFLLMCLLSDSIHGLINEKHFREDYDYIEALQSYYKLHTTPKNWENAKKVCAEEGASLFYAKTSVEASAVISFWKLHQKNSTTWVYVGISDIATEGVYETIDGKLISEVYHSWNKAQPDNTNNHEDCLHMNQEGLLNDISCDSEFSFICKKSLPSLEKNYDCKNAHSNSDGQRVEKFFRKDYTYIESEQSFYKIHTTARTFTDAKRTCALEGAVLFYAENVEEANAVASFWNRTQPSIPWVFVGLTDQMAEGLFETIDGRPIFEVYSSWQSFQPNNFGDNEDCVYMNPMGTMNDYICDFKTAFICKKSLKSLKRNNNCNMPNSDYTFNKDIGKCYKLHTTPMNWTDAYAICRTELTSLAMINNRMEADYLATLAESTPKPRILGKYQKGIYHVGFHNRFNEGWQTVAGTPMTTDADTWFGNILPDDGPYEECGSMFFNGRLINTSCNMKSLFICEKTVTPTSNSTIDENEENYMLL